MNKAFVREPDSTGPQHCPRCGSVGVPAGAEALAEHIVPEALSAIAEGACFCPFPRCEVAYFDMFERIVSVEQLRYPVWPKDLDAPLCPCFGLTRDDVEQDLREGGVSRVRSVVERARTAEARCAALSPDGRSCVAEVQRYYMQRRQALARDA